MEEFTFYESSKVNTKDKRVGWLMGITVALCAAIIVLFVLFITGNNNSSVVDYTPKTISGDLKIAFINSDSLWANYEFVKAKKEELAELEAKYQGQYDYLRKKFEQDYNDYVKKGTAGQLTLAQQKEAEATLGEQQQRLMKMDEELTDKFLQEKTVMNQMLLDTILNYIHRYNERTGYDFILEYSKISGIFYANDSLDITENILNGLNFEYRKRK
jgi:outer membrane protein